MSYPSYPGDDAGQPSQPYGAKGPATPGGAAYAGWGQRVGAVIIDSIPTLVVFFLALALFGTTSTGDGSASFQLTGGGAAVYYLFALVWFLYNWVYRQGTTGQTVGKKVLGIAVLRADTGGVIGPGLSFGRQFAHILDALPCGLGYLWPLWDAEKRTFADMICATRVRRA